MVETDRGGKSTFHGPGQLVCYPILDLNRHGRDVRKYCRDLEEAVIRTVEPFGLEATRIDGLTGVWLERPPRKIASIGVHISRWVTTHGYALNVDLDPAPFTDWITACGLEDAAFTTIARELGRAVTVDEVRPHAAAAIARGLRARARGASRRRSGRESGRLRRGGTRSSSRYSMPFRGSPRRPTASDDRQAPRPHRARRGPCPAGSGGSPTRERDLLAFDDREALAGKDEEALLRRLAVVGADRLARLRAR